MESSRILRSVGVVSSFTMLSRVLGLVRDVLMFYTFGVSLEASVFVMAFMIPNLFRRFFGEGALSASFVPVFVQTRKEKGNTEAWSLARKIFSWLVFVLICITLVMTGVITLVLPHITDQKLGLLLELLRIMLPYMVFICMVALCMAVLNAFNHFAIPAATPCLLNICWILSIIFLAPFFGETDRARIYGVAWGILFAGVVQLLAQIPMMWKKGWRPAWQLTFKDPGVLRVLKAAMPVAAAAAITQLNVLLDRFMAALAGAHGPSALFFSERLIYLPLGLFATALGTVLLPTFSRKAAEGMEDEIRRTINFSIRNLLYIMIPASLALLFLARPLLEMIFLWKTQGESGIDYVVSALRCYAPGLIVFSLAKIFVPVFYGMQDTRTPVKVAFFTVLLNIVLNIIFLLTWPKELKHAGLALGTVIAETVYVIALALLLHRRLVLSGWKQILVSSLKCILAAVLMVVICNWMMDGLSAIFFQWDLQEKVIQIASVFIAIPVSMIIYLLLTYLFKSPEIHELFSAGKEKNEIPFPNS